MADIFNEESLQALDDRNEGEELARVSHPSLTFVLIAMAALCAVAIFWCAFGTINYRVMAQGVVFPFDRPQAVSAEKGGTVIRTLAKHGQEVKTGDALLEIRTETGDTTMVAATLDGTLLACRGEEDSFAQGESIAWLNPTATDSTRRELLAYVSFDDLRRLHPGQQVQVTPADLQREDWGYAYGHIVAKEQLPTTREEVAQRLKLAPLASFIGDGAVYEVRIRLDAGKDGQQLNWSREKSQKLTLSLGTLCNVQVVTEERRVWEVLVGSVSNTVDNVEGN